MRIDFTYRVRSVRAYAQFQRDKLNYRRADYNELNKELGGEDWDALFINANMQEAYDRFLAAYHKACKANIPILTVRLRGGGRGKHTFRSPKKHI